MLTAKDIEKLATRKNVKKIAVENFLGSLEGMSMTDAFENARADGKSYGWNAATQNAIAAGISKHFKK